MFLRRQQQFSTALLWRTNVPQRFRVPTRRYDDERFGHQCISDQVTARQCLEGALICSYGLEYDRRWMLVDPEAHMITQRECPRVATLHPEVESGACASRRQAAQMFFVPHDAASWTEP